MLVTIRPEAPEDAEAIRRVHCAAFPQEGEANLVDALRREGYNRVSLVALADDRVIGHALWSAIEVVGERQTWDALSLAPVAVVPEFQHRGVGSQLIRAGLAACREQGHRLAFVLGEPAYYGRFGFSAALAAAIESPFPREYFQGLELAPGAMLGVQGIVRYSPPFLEV